MEKQKKLSREELAKLEIGVTSISGRQKFILCLLFIGFIFSYPLFQAVYEYRMRSLDDASKLQMFAIFSGLRSTDAPEGQPFWELIFSLNRQICNVIKDYETTLEETSALRAGLLPPAQRLLTGTLRTGNEKAIVGRDGWLFYSSGVNYLANAGFLLPEKLHKRLLSGVQPDPVKGVIHFAEQLKLRGIRLILLPVPVKAMLYGEMLGGEKGVLQNQSFAEFKRRVEAAGVTVIDPSDELLKLKESGVEVFLKSDTHWTPAGMQLVAEIVAREAGGDGESDFAMESTQITALGDIAAMLKLANPEEFFEPEMVEIEMVDVAANSAGRILLLGDSFTNIFSIGAMNWGVRGGFAEHLAVALGEAPDVISRNDAGAYATRQLLANELRRGRDRLAGKEVVIWEFAIRELADGDWKLLDMSLGEAPESLFFTPDAPCLVSATVLGVTAVPRPNSAPYKDHVMSLHIGDINGGSDQAVVFIVSMRSNVWSEAASLRIGETVELTLSPWSNFEEEYNSWNRSEFDDAELLIQTPCWGEINKTGDATSKLSL